MLHQLNTMQGTWAAAKGEPFNHLQIADTPHFLTSLGAHSAINIIQGLGQRVECSKPLTNNLGSRIRRGKDSH